MLSSLVLALAIRASNPAVSPDRAQVYAKWVQHEAARRHLDPWLFQAIIDRETRWTPQAIRHESDGSCSVGLGQINGSCVESNTSALLDPHINIERMGLMLSRMRSSCRHDCEHLGWARAYNPGSPAYFEAVRKAVDAYHGQSPEPVVHRVRTEMPVPKLPREGAH